ncbi:MAG: chorismate synthase, partial [Treponema sp.]|nr:chorismate synthase [Treponema sp.]
AAKAIEFGAGFAASRGTGSELNDALIPYSPLPTPHSLLPTPRSPLPPGIPPASFKTNNSGGVLGGLSSGTELRFTVAFKPISSIGKPQETINRQGEKAELVVHGRHDACVAPRAVPVVEAMCALVLADFLLLQRAARV